MSGQSGSIHGLTGKALMYELSPMESGDQTLTLRQLLYKYLRIVRSLPIRL